MHVGLRVHRIAHTWIGTCRIHVHGANTAYAMRNMWRLVTRIWVYSNVCKHGIRLRLELRRVTVGVQEIEVQVCIYILQYLRIFCINNTYRDLQNKWEFLTVFDG